MLCAQQHVLKRDTGEEFIIEPTYPKGKPDELEGIILDKNFIKNYIFEL